MRKFALPFSLVLIATGATICVTTFKAPPQTPDGVSVLLKDRTRAWWNGHALPRTKETVIINAAPQEQWAFIPEIPPLTPGMPPEVAHWLVRGPAPTGHPFHGRGTVLVDVRKRSDVLEDGLEKAVNVPVRGLKEAFTSGALSSAKKDSTIIVAGQPHPHFEVIALFRAAGFSAVYFLEGGIAAWKAQGLPMSPPGSVSDYKAALAAEKIPDAPAMPAPPDAGIRPVALKALMDAAVPIRILFVGEEKLFREAHIPGAVRVPIADASSLETEDRTRLIAVYCGCCEGMLGGWSADMVRVLREKGFTRILHLDGHFKAWKDAGLPVVSSSD